MLTLNRKGGNGCIKLAGGKPISTPKPVAPKPIQVNERLRTHLINKGVILSAN